MGLVHLSAVARVGVGLPGAVERRGGRAHSLGDPAVLEPRGPPLVSAVGRQDVTRPTGTRDGGAQDGPVSDGRPSLISSVWSRRAAAYRRRPAIPSVCLRASPVRFPSYNAAGALPALPTACCRSIGRRPVRVGVRRALLLGADRVHQIDGAPERLQPLFKRVAVRGHDDLVETGVAVDSLGLSNLRARSG